MKVGQIGPGWNAAAQKPDPIPAKKAEGGRSRTDRLLKESPGFEEKPESMDKILKMLSVRYPDLTFITEDIEGEDDVKALAAKYGKGCYLVLSEDYLSWMAEGETAYRQGMDEIRKAADEIRRAMSQGCQGAGAVLSQNAESYLWTLNQPGRKPGGGNGAQDDGFEGDGTQSGGEERPKDSKLAMAERMIEQMKKMHEQRAEQLKKQSLIKIRKKLNYRMGRDMARLSRVSQDRFVRSFISGVYARRTQISGSSGYEKKEVAAAVRQMDYVIRCAKTKIRQLKEERALEIREEKLREAKEEKKRLLVEKELKEKKTRRKSTEHARIFEDLPDLPGLRSQEERRMAAEEFLSYAQAAGLDSAVTAPAADGAGQAGPEGQMSGGPQASQTDSAASADVSIQTL